jgi:ectoine hydroxylase-related dioxygenase (phytanoyl-CoA dioxygenase family)
MTFVGKSLVSKEDKAAFDRDGAVLLRGLIDQTAQDSLREAIARELERPQEFFGRRLLWRSDPDFARFCRESCTPQIIAELFGTSTVNLFMDQLFAKAPGTITRTGWHNDLPYWPIKGWQVATTWVALDPINKENGALELIRGSHKWNRRYQPFQPDLHGGAIVSKGAEGEIYDPLPDFETERDRHDIISWEMQPGDVLVFHAMTVHGAAGNNTAEQWRRAYAIRYTGEDVRYYEPATNEWLYNPALTTGDVLDSKMYPRVFGS